jgi:hypothetical protein
MYLFLPIIVHIGHDQRNKLEEYTRTTAYGLSGKHSELRQIL